MPREIIKSPDNPFVTPSAGLLVEPRTPGRFITSAFTDFFRTHTKQMWDLDAIPFNKIQRELVTEGDIKAARGAMLVESHNPVYTAELLNYFRADHEMTSFIVTWSYEELKHYVVLRTWLESVGEDPEGLEKELTETRSGPWGEAEANFTLAQSLTYTMLQEEVTGLFYKRFNSNTKEPVLKQILTLIGKDEYRHCQWYLAKAKEALKNNHHARDEIDAVLLSFGMPGPTFISNYEEYNAAMRQVAAPGARDLAEVLRKVAELVGVGHTIQLGNSSSYVQKIREGWNMDPMSVLKDVLGSKLPFSSRGDSQE